MCPSQWIETTDTVLILDCCYAGSVVRGASTKASSSGLIAAVEPSQRSFGNLSSLVRRTFTSHYIAFRRVQNDSPLTLSEAVETLRKDAHKDRLLCYHLPSGETPIRIPLRPSTSSSNTHRNTLSSESSGVSIMDMTDRYYVIFNIHVDISPNQQCLKELTASLQNLPPPLEVDLIGAYTSRSTFLVFKVPWRVWAGLSNYPG